MSRRLNVSPLFVITSGILSGYFHLVTLTMLVASSKCPEPRKPHETNCTAFYNCLDLPDGQHAWLPATCDHGLIFEPQLSTCVIPEDPRTCEIRLNKNPQIVTKYNLPHSSLWTSDIDSGIYSRVSLVAQPTSRNVSTAINVLDRDPAVESFIDECKNTVIASNGRGDKIFITFINALLKKMLMRCSMADGRTRHSSEYCNDLLRFCQSVKATNDSRSQVETELDESATPEASLVSITDNLGNKRYVSVEKYRSLKDKLTSEKVAVVPCVDGFRLPNATDCSRYYVCDVKAVRVVEFACPSNTAFNGLKRRCDRRGHELCSQTLPGKPLPLNPCKVAGKMADPRSDRHYYLCRHSIGKTTLDSVRLSCPAHLAFCPKTSTCTLEYLCGEYNV